MKLPTWKESRERLANGTADNLDRFIHEYEPVGIAESYIWRAGLTKALATAQRIEEPITFMAVEDNTLPLPLDV